MNEIDRGVEVLLRTPQGKELLETLERLQALPLPDQMERAAFGVPIAEIQSTLKINSSQEMINIFGPLVHAKILRGYRRAADGALVVSIDSLGWSIISKLRDEPSIASRLTLSSLTNPQSVNNHGPVGEQIIIQGGSHTFNLRKGDS